MHSALLVGKNQNVSWQINGFGVGKSINPMVNNPDPYATFSQNSQTILEGVVNLSSQHAKPGSFQWSGDDFIAAPSHFMRQLHPELSELKGSIQVKDGRVVQMYVSHSGLYRFEYEGSTNRPGWFPARIMHVGGPNFFIDEVIAIEKVEFSPLENVRELTLAETHILPEVALVTVYSNSTLVSSFNPDDTNAARIVRAQFDDLSLSNKIRNRRLPIVVGLIALTVVVPIGCRLLASRPGRIK
jgi:hypothetical protein